MGVIRGGERVTLRCRQCGGDLELTPVSTVFVARVSWPMVLGKPAYLARTWTQHGAEHHWTTDEHAALAWRFADRTDANKAFEAFARSRTHTLAILEVLEVPAMVSG